MKRSLKIVAAGIGALNESKMITSRKDGNPELS
jgi:hypothetical protein